MKTSNKFAIAMIMVFGLFPAIGYILVHESMADAEKELTIVANRLSTNTIRVVQVAGERDTHRLLSILPLLYGRSEINLNVQPQNIFIKGDTLFLNLSDNSRVYQGYIHIKNLNSAIINSDTITYNATTL